MPQPSAIRTLEDKDLKFLEKLLPAVVILLIIPIVWGPDRTWIKILLCLAFIGVNLVLSKLVGNYAPKKRQKIETVKNLINSTAIFLFTWYFPEGYFWILAVLPISRAMIIFKSVPTILLNSGVLAFSPVSLIGHNFPLHSVFMPVSTLVAVSVLFYAVSRRLIKKNAQIAKNNEELRDSLLKNKTLIRILSHDINNHLSTALGGVTMLIEKPEARKINRYLPIIGAALGRIDEITKDVKFYTAMESGKIELKMEEIVPSDIVNDSIQAFRDRLEKKEMSIKFSDRLPKDLRVRLSKVSFENNILNNLISNAIKFSNRGDEIFIETGLEDGFIHFKISDHGCGIPEEIQEKIYDFDAVTSHKGTEGESGTGFGMPIVKMFVEKHNGTIELNSAPSGTTFLIKIPKGC